MTINVTAKDANDNTYSYSHRVRLLFQRWFVDAMGFFARKWTGDEELVTEIVATGDMGDGSMRASTPRTHVLRKSGRDSSTDTGVMLTLFNTKYPRVGMSFGLSFPSDRSPNYYLGLSYRFTNLDNRASATIASGLVASEVLTFPGIVEGEGYASTSPLLNGAVDYSLRASFSVTLGFSLPGREN